MFDDGDGPRTESARSLYSPYLVSNGFLISSAGLGQYGYLSESLDLPCVFFLLGAGILHSMEKATQLVHGTPKLAASQRTCASSFSKASESLEWPTTYLSRVTGLW